MALTRERIKNNYIRRMVQRRDLGLTVLSEEELAITRAAALAEAGTAEGVWVFGYGSLIWNPAFHFAERRAGTLQGYRRRYCLWTQLGRGSPEHPGLMLGIEPGGHCGGALYRIAPEQVEEETDILWKREMVGGAYRASVLPVQSDGREVRAITFVINPGHPRYTGPLSQERVVSTIASAAGDIGTCAEYLFSTVQHLEALGVEDAHMRLLQEEVAQRINAKAEC